MKESFTKEDAEKFKNLGNEQFKLFNFSNALKHYDQSIEIDPSNPVYHCNRATVLLKLDRYQDAEYSATESIALDNRYIRAYLRKAEALKKMDKNREAIAMYNAVINLDPNNQEALDGVRVKDPIDLMGNVTKGFVDEGCKTQ